MVAGEPVAPAPVPPQYLCPITGEVMEDPVTTADGHAYERAAIAQWLSNHDTSPVTNAQLPHRKLAPAHALRQLIQEFVATNPEAFISTEPSYTERRCSGSVELPHPTSATRAVRGRPSASGVRSGAS